MSLSDLLKSDRRTIFLDGAMGTQLGAAGLEMGGQNNLSHPDAVQAVHEAYAACGIDLIITNTLTMNRVNIESHKVGVDVRDVNLAGARLAKAATREGQFVLGDIGSTGKMLQPYGPLSKDEAFASFKEQAEILVEGGVHGFIVETMIDLEEALCAVSAIMEASDLPIIASIAFTTPKNGGRTIMGNTAAQCAAKLAEAGAWAVGANCGNIDPLEMADIVAIMRDATSVPIIAQPNAGKAQMIDKRLSYGMTPAAFAAGLSSCMRAGARLLGGCCGTEPAHIEAMMQLVGKD
jgi:5-methyltetrahydrofolate--homocysteine methyltransferase